MKKAELIAPHTGIQSFYKAPVVDIDKVQKGDAVIAGVPMDHGIVLTRTGTRYGPRAIREASLFYRAVQEGASEKTSVNVQTKKAQRLKERIKLVDVGDIPIYPQDIKQTSESITEDVSFLVKNETLPVLLGGDHYITYPAFEGLCKGFSELKNNAKIGHVHIDSHTDFRDSYAGLGKFNHGTSVRRLSENPMIEYKNIAWVGLNGNVIDSDIYNIYKKEGLRMITSGDIVDNGIESAIVEAVEAASDGTDAVYLSIDIDVVDTAYAPGTGIPVFEGITSKDFLIATEILSKYPIVKAIDLCEVSPPFDPSERTAYLAANGLVTLLSPYIFDVVDAQ